MTRRSDISQEPQKSHTPRELANELVSALSSQRKLALLLDYDGTLADIVDDPKAAILDAPIRNILCTLSEHPNIRVALISGRSEESLREVSGIELDSNIDFATNGGLRISSSTGSWTHPKALERLPKLQALAAQLENSVQTHPGAWLENKHLSLALHYRDAPSNSEAALRRLVKEEFGNGQGEFRLVEGKAIFEIQPAISWDKGIAARNLVQRWGRELALGEEQAPHGGAQLGKGLSSFSSERLEDKWLVFFAGDDLIDLPAFDFATQQQGIACLVESQEGKVALNAVNAFLKSPAECREMLKKLLESLKAHHFLLPKR